MRQKLNRSHCDLAGEIKSVRNTLHGEQNLHLGGNNHNLDIVRLKLCNFRRANPRPHKTLGLDNVITRHPRFRKDRGVERLRSEDYSAYCILDQRACLLYERIISATHSDLRISVSGAKYIAPSRHQALQPWPTSIYYPVVNRDANTHRTQTARTLAPHVSANRPKSPVGCKRNFEPGGRNDAPPVSSNVVAFTDHPFGSHSFG